MVIYPKGPLVIYIYIYIYIWVKNKVQYIGCWVQIICTFYSNNQSNYNIGYVIICNNGL
jgi:hypothetical protein